MTIQKGDKFLCKRTNQLFEEDNYYEIDDVIIDINGHFLVDVSDGESSGMVLVVELVGHENYDYVNKKRQTYFYNTFYSKKEERKIKLDSINGNN